VIKLIAKNIKFDLIEFILFIKFPKNYWSWSSRCHSENQSSWITT